ncbi:hypothetical protein HMI54_005656 [Coelomomyces lativittatus]|nr:hypothetical protein HMI54_005656 [Coelomomyces lativittatus]
MQSQNDIQKVLNRFSDQIMYRIGINTPIQLTDVLNKPLNMFAQTRLFWNQSYIIITIILVLLSILLIYTLLLSNVEEKTFEFGLLRTLGLAQPRLFLLMFLQAMMFAIPGIVFGIIVCLILYVPIDYLLGRFTEVPLTLFLDWGAGVLGVTLGLFLPLLGMWVPVRRVLTATLRDALDKYHQSVFDVIVSIKKLNDLGIHQNQTVLALIMVGLSILVFYSGPVSFKMNFLETFMQIMSVLFIVLILGQVLLMHLVQPILQRLILHCIVWGPDCLFKQIIQKNLFAHRSRNHKAALTFTLCISYLLCSGALFQMQLNSLVENLQWSIGADILISSDTYSNALPENTLNQFLTQNSTNPSVALSWTYVSYPLQSLPMVKKIKFSSLAAINRATVQVIGVESNYLDVTFNDPFFFPVALNDPDSSPFTQLSDMKRMPVIISEATSNYVFLSLSDVSRLDISYFKQGNSVWSTAFSILCKNIGIIKKLPGFPTINRMTKLNAPLFISMQSFQGLLHRLVQEAEWTSINTNIVPKEHLRIRLNPNADQNTLDFFINSLGTTIQKTLGSNIKIKVLHDNIKIAETSVFFVNIFFNTGISHTLLCLYIQ